MLKSCVQPAIHYDRYRLNIRELAWGLGKGIAVCGVLSYTYYRSIYAFLWMLPFAAAGPVAERKRLMKKRKQELALQFKESMMILASSLSDRLLY